MRFTEKGPSIPNHLLKQSDAGRVVFFCGAGVSRYGINSDLHMPDFLELTRRVANYFKPSKESDIERALRTWDKNTIYRPVPLDEIFFLLQNSFCKEEVNQVVANILSSQHTGMSEPTRHKHISQISRNSEGHTQIVTTNFDVLFERAIQDSTINTHRSPFLPDLSQGAPVTGITYLHGRVPESTQHTDHNTDQSSDLVLSSSDLGRAYLSEGWATEFVRHLVYEYTVVLIGYKADDPPIHYLLLGMGSSNKFRQSNLYAFDRGDSDTLESKWRAKGVTPIGYSDHDHLWKTIEMWANRSINIREWRDQTLSIASEGPRSAEPFERGQIVYLMNTVDGAKKFSELKPSAHPEWINVFDHNIRRKRGYIWRDFAEDGTAPKSPYILDDDNSNDELSCATINPAELLKLSNDEYNNSSISRDKFSISEHFIDWICKNFEKATMIWWFAAQNYIDISTIRYLKQRLQRNRRLSKKVRMMWNIVLEYQSHKADSDFRRDWRQLSILIKTEGWSETSVREFSRLMTPKIIENRDARRAMRLPREEDIDSIDLDDIIEIDVRFSKRPEKSIEIPDEFLLPVIRALQENLAKASLMIAEVDFLNGGDRRTTPTLYQDRAVSGDISYKEFTSEVLWFLRLFTRLVKVDPASARSLVFGWPLEDYYFFRKFKLFGLKFPSLFNIKEALDFIISLTKEQLWCQNSKRELLFLIEDRKDEFTRNDRKLIIDKILTPPLDVFDSGGDKEEELRFAKYISGNYGNYLVKKKFRVSKETKSLIRSFIEDLEYLKHDDDYIVRESESSYNRVSTDYNTDSLEGASDKDVIDIADRESAPTSGLFRFHEKDPFSGLVRIKPHRALNALIEKKKVGLYPLDYWQRFFEELPLAVSDELYNEVIAQIIDIPEKIIFDLGDVLHRFFAERFREMLDVNEASSWELYDKYLSVWIDGGKKHEESRGRPLRHSRTYSRAIRQPVGKITKCLVSCISERTTSLPDNVKLRIQKLMLAPGEGRYHCIAILANNVSLLYSADADWTQHQVIPHFSFDRDTSESAWNGLILGDEKIINPVASSLMNFIAVLFPWVNRYSWAQEDLNKCAYLVIETGIEHSKEFHIDYNDKVRDCIRGMNEDCRFESISFLHDLVFSRREWSRIVVPFITNVWPKDTRLHTEKLTLGWIDLLADSGDEFQTVYSAVKNFLVPIEYSRSRLGIFFNDQNEQGSLADKFPMDVLDLLNKIIPREVDYLYINLPKMLEKLSATRTSIINDSRYIRLLDISEVAQLRLDASEI